RRAKVDAASKIIKIRKLVKQPAKFVSHNMSRVKICNCRQARLHFAAFDRGTQQPRAQVSSPHSRHRLINNVKERATAGAAQRINEFKIADSYIVEDQVILGLKIDEICNVSRSGSLCILSIT